MPSRLIERKIDYTKIITSGFDTAVNEKQAMTIAALTSPTAESVLLKSKYSPDSAQTYAFAFGYLLGVISKVAIRITKDEVRNTK